MLTCFLQCYCCIPIYLLRSNSIAGHRLWLLHNIYLNSNSFLTFHFAVLYLTTYMLTVIAITFIQLHLTFLLLDQIIYQTFITNVSSSSSKQFSCAISNYNCFFISNIFRLHIPLHFVNYDWITSSHLIFIESLLVWMNIRLCCTLTSKHWVYTLSNIQTTVSSFQLCTIDDSSVDLLTSIYTSIFTFWF